MNQPPNPSAPGQQGDSNSQAKWARTGVASLPADVSQIAASRNSNGSDDEPPIVGQRTVAVAGIRDPGGWLEWFTDWTEETLGSESYGAPRVFDLFTMLAITLAFALLFAFMKLLEPAFSASMPLVMFAISAFLVLTGLGQAIFWNGKKPRIASLATGPLNFAIVGVALLMLSSEMRNPAMMIGLVCLSISGLPLGYLAGTVVAGVFLLADKFRQSYMPAETREVEPVDIWSDLPKVSDSTQESGNTPESEQSRDSE